MFVVNYKVTSPGVLEQFIENLDYQDKVLVSVRKNGKYAKRRFFTTFLR